MEAGYDSLLHDKTRPSRIPPLGSGITERVVTLTQTAPPSEATHWMKDNIAYAFGAEFIEVRINRWTHEIRVPRLVGAFAAGRIMNPRTARSQLMGGLIWGMSSALLEATELDERYARYVNDNLADYLVPVNADVPSVEVILLSEEDDHINPAGVKGLGELANVGTNAAICNAIFHATGQRIRKLPVRLENLEI